MGISFKHTGDLSKTFNFLTKASRVANSLDMDKYGKQGVRALQAATPKDTGRTADSWYYEIVKDGKGFTINWLNSNINKGVVVAVIIQYGHGTGSGGYVQGTDYINPAMSKVFESIANDIWKEVTK